MSTRLDEQIAFLKEADRLKSVLRATRLLDDSRLENSAEHSWHAMLFALVLADQAAEPVDINVVLKMLLVHDLVEIDAGDEPLHAGGDPAAKQAAEIAAADRLFGLLPDDLSKEFRRIWDDFEAGDTPESRYAKAIDRLPPPLANLETGGGSWVDYNVTMDQIDTRVGVPVIAGAPGIWAWLRPRLLEWFNRNGRAT